MICDTILESWRTCRWTASSWWWRNSAWSWPPPPTSPHSLSGWSTSTFQYGSQNVVIFIHITNMHLKYSGTKGFIKSKIKRQILFISFCSRLFQMHICNVYKKIYNLWPILKVEVLHPDKECVEVRSWWRGTAAWWTPPSQRWSWSPSSPSALQSRVAYQSIRNFQYYSENGMTSLCKRERQR